jgi:hypothetical protein
MSSIRLPAMCLFVVCFGAGLACEKSEPPSPTPPSPKPAAEEAPVKATAPSAASPTVTTAPSVDLSAVPAREDFEEEAEKAITPANLEKQLEGLEHEVAAD